MNVRTWLWQVPDWPALTFDLTRIAAPLAAARLAQGRLLGKTEALDELGQLPTEQRVWTEEALATAAIEGDVLDASALRSSIARRLGLAGPAMGAPRAVEGLLDMMQDASHRWDEPLTPERLCAWQAALFPTGRSGLHPIVTGQWRSGPEPMRIVSGPLDREVVHYEAPPAAAVPAEMQALLAWFNTPTRGGRHDGLVRAALAHLWFETVHPFEDGNGRVGRALLDLALAQDVRAAWRMHGASVRLNKDRQAYYDMLNQAQRGDVDVTAWVVWFLETFARACVDSTVVVEEAVERGQYWARFRHVSLDERQRKALSRMLDAGRRGFEGGMTLRKYLSLTGTSRATAQRDLAHLVDQGLLVSMGAGRATRYELPMPHWRWNAGDASPAAT